VNGQRVDENSRTQDREAAESLLKLRLAEAAAGQINIVPSKITVADICGLVLADNKLRKLRDAKTVEWRYEAHVKPSLGKIQANRMTTAHSRAYIESRRLAGAPNSTINRELSVVRRAYTLAMREEPPLVRRAPYIPRLDEDNVRQGFIERPQYEALLAELPVNLKALFVSGYHVGARKGELRKIQWAQVDFDARLITLSGVQTKNKKPRTLPIYGEMETWLRLQYQSHPDDNPWVFYGARNRPVGDHLDGWTEACERAGLPGLLFHDLRRSAVRNMKRAGIQDRVAMEISGHRTRSMFDRYNIVDESDIENAGQKLEAYFKKSRPAKLKRVK
jgi:integrase